VRFYQGCILAAAALLISLDASIDHCKDCLSYLLCSLMFPQSERPIKGHVNAKHFTGKTMKGVGEEGKAKDEF